MRYKLWIFPTYIPQTDIHFGLLLQGDIQVIESAQFGISVNISGKSTYELSSVHIQYTAINDTILLQVVREGFDQLQKEELSIWLRSPMVPLTIFFLIKTLIAAQKPGGTRLDLGHRKSDWTKRYCFYLPDHPENGIALLIFSTVAYYDCRASSLTYSCQQTCSHFEPDP